MAISIFLSDASWEIQGMGGGYPPLITLNLKKDTSISDCQSYEHPPITLNLKKGTRTSDYQSNKPPPPPEVYSHPFYMYLICPQEITYNPCPEGSAGLSSSKT